MSKSDELSRYAELSEWIRELSSPQIEGIDSALEYRERFIKNYEKIHELSAISRDILERELFTLLKEERLFTDDEVEALFAFCDLLLDSVGVECTDVILRDHVHDRMLKDARQKNDTTYLLRVLDGIIEDCYFLMNLSGRFCDVTDFFTPYQEKAMAAADEVLSYLDKEKFCSLPDFTAKQIVLVNARYVNAIYESAQKPEPMEMITGNIDAMERSLALAHDAFYIDQASKYNWQYHIYRSLQGIAYMTEFHNRAGIPQNLLQKINFHTRQMVALWKADKVTYGVLNSKETLHQCMYRNAYLAGEMSKDRYLEELRLLLEGAQFNDHSFDGYTNRIFSLTEYMLTLDQEALTKEQTDLIRALYKSIVTSAQRMPKLGSLTIILAYLKQALFALNGADAGISYPEFLMELLASVLPQAYMHSLCVGELCSAFIERVLEVMPKRLKEVPGYPDKDALCAFAYNMGVLHDTGKLMIAEVILTYSRDRLEAGNAFYKESANISAYLLEACEETRPYAKTVREYRRPYRETGIMEQILYLMNDLEWMTCEIRYTSTPLLTYQDFAKRAEKFSDKRYAPDLAKLLKDEETAALLQTILENGREKIYEDTFRLLKQGA
ncbi:MAG: hypothetical protein IJR58_07730 [Lachnospiraceae bacterium]|nr:hypothetical protein [Lachnospiraceae bacterium]